MWKSLIMKLSLVWYGRLLKISVCCLAVRLECFAAFVNNVTIANRAEGYYYVFLVLFINDDEVLIILGGLVFA